MKWNILAAVLLVLAVSTGFAEILETIDAIVNGEIILSSEVDEQILVNLRQQDPNFSPLSLTNEDLAEARRLMLRRLINDMLILQETRNQLSPDQYESVMKDVDKATEDYMIQFRSQFKTPAELAAQEQKMNMTLDEMWKEQRKLFQRTYLERFVVPQLAPQKITQPSSNELKTFQELHPDLKPSDKIQIVHFLFRVPAGASGEEDAQILARAKEFMTRARAGENITELMRHYSDPEQAKALESNPGLITISLSAIQNGEFLPEFEQVIGLKENEVSEPFRTERGYHVVKIINKDSMEAVYMRFKGQQVANQWIDELRKKAKIEILQEKTLSLYES
ncbi:MAG: hypothetical protein C4527_17140 [Candidatus Omnitrophota bacterium]|jgi:parvulin-like peptidyl-prolyl isomerase|nr:MAG: hypothetical protein C4527_17140 [Candidatus Omnitrophota bacterium]